MTEIWADIVTQVMEYNTINDKALIFEIYSRFYQLIP